MARTFVLPQISARLADRILENDKFKESELKLLFENRSVGQLQQEADELRDRVHLPALAINQQAQECQERLLQCYATNRALDCREIVLELKQMLANLNH
jgi:hypothetical protein